VRSSQTLDPHEAILEPDIQNRMPRRVSVPFTVLEHQHMKTACIRSAPVLK
jgi:hypothetical protein